MKLKQSSKRNYITKETLPIQKFNNYAPQSGQSEQLRSKKSLKAFTPVTIALGTLKVKNPQKYVFYLRYLIIW